MSYNFPVELQDVYLRSGTQVPRAKAVVRTDTGEALSTVSNRYRLVTHQEMVERAEGFMRTFGEPERQFSLARNGGLMVGSYTFKERGVDVNKGDIVGLRLYLESAYLGTKKNRVRVGALRLWCLNGATFSESVFDLAFSHTHRQVDEFVFPQPDEVLERFTAGVNRYKQYGTIVLSEAEYKRIGEEAVQVGVIPERALLKSPTPDLPAENSAWRLYNQMTWYVNHESRAGQISKVNRLERIDRFFKDTFAA